jgi:hypothetical protein
MAPSAAMAASVEPLLDDGTFQESVTCRDLGFYFWNKIEGWGYGTDPEGDYYGYYDTPGQLKLDPAYANTISIFNYRAADRLCDWTVDPFPVGLVYVKAGTLAHYFYYDPEVFGDFDAYPPVTADNVSHVSWCWNVTGENGDECYQDETAWADGDRYVERGNWATYSPYVADSCVTLYAGQTMDAGTACFSNESAGYVDIIFELANGFIFYYDVADDEDDNIKIQDYEFAPSGNPAPGLFLWKAMAPVGSTVYTVTVPLNNFYGIHLDVAYQIDCPESEPEPVVTTPGRHAKSGK